MADKKSKKGDAKDGDPTDDAASDADDDESKEDPNDPNAPGLPGFVGVGLLGGVIVGFDPLRDAVRGYGPFDTAMLRFLACVLVCVTAASLIGRLIDSVPRDDDSSDDELDEAGNGVGAGNEVKGTPESIESADGGGATPADV